LDIFRMDDYKLASKQRIKEVLVLQK